MYGSVSDCSMMSAIGFISWRWLAVVREHMSTGMSGIAKRDAGRALFGGGTKR